MPLDYMLRIMRDPDLDPARRDVMARSAAPMCHPQLQAIAHKSASRPQQGAGELPGLMKRDRASSTDLGAGRLTGLARSRSGHCPILEATKRHGFRETARP